MKNIQNQAWKWAALAAAAGLLGACASTPDSRISANPQAFNQLPPDQQAMIRSGQVGVGMDMTAVRIALGDPDRISYRTDTQGKTEVWHYVSESYYDGTFLYAGPYWGPHGRYRHWGGWGWGGSYPYATAVTVYDHYRIVFKDGRVTTIMQEAPAP